MKSSFAKKAAILEWPNWSKVILQSKPNWPEAVKLSFTAYDRSKGRHKRQKFVEHFHLFKGENTFKIWQDNILQPTEQ